ncbi:MAG: hypothetical protein C5B49_12405 [Bdellovibrio sp.]|nr:MAG: hypothetical protein C5B49_12405 [Bdellovibrio sp.]
MIILILFVSTVRARATELSAAFVEQNTAEIIDGAPESAIELGIFLQDLLDLFKEFDRNNRPVRVFPPDNTFFIPELGKLVPGVLKK